MLFYQVIDRSTGKVCACYATESAANRRCVYLDNEAISCELPCRYRVRPIEFGAGTAVRALYSYP